MVATEHGKEYAHQELERRRRRFAKQTLPRNEDMPAGSPMVFRCIGCGAPIWVNEGYITKPDMCPECEALHNLGWMT